MAQQRLDAAGPGSPYAPAGTAVGLALLGAVAFLCTSGLAQQLVYHAVSLGSAAAVCWGVRLHRPAHPRPWLLLAGGLAVMTAADVGGDALRAGLPVPAWLPVLTYVLAWALLVHAVRSLARIRMPDGDGDAVLDAVAVVVALGLVLWGVVLDPALRTAPMSAASPVAVSAFPLAQIALLALYLRLLFSGGPRVLASWVLCLGGGVCGLVGSTAYVALVAAGEYQPGAWNNLFWIAAYAAPGIAALVPDMREVSVPVQSAAEVSMARWTVLASALLATTATTCFTADRMSTGAVLATALPVPLIVLWRLRGVLLSRQQAVRRAELESARNALVARLAGEAVSAQIVELRQVACQALSAELGCEVRLVPAGGVARAAGVLAVPVGPAPDSQLLEVTLPPGRAWGASDQAVVHSVANVLGAAEARHLSEERVRWAADHDPLTDLPNRSCFRAALADAVESAPPGHVVVLFLDLDGFKQVNDGHGHTAGDAVLVATARRLRATCRQQDVVARLGGDEFVLLCRVPSAATVGQGLAARVRDVVTQPVATGDVVVSVGVSVGIGVNRAGDTAEELLRRADERMYEAKHCVR